MGLCAGYDKAGAGRVALGLKHVPHRRAQVEIRELASGRGACLDCLEPIDLRKLILASRGRNSVFAWRRRAPSCQKSIGMKSADIGLRPRRSIRSPAYDQFATLIALIARATATLKKSK